MKSWSFTKLLLGLGLALVLGLHLGAPELLAQTTNVAQTGLDTVGTTAGLSAQDPTIIVARIIRGFLGVLGIIATVIILYAGFVWMTAGGSQERVDRAKRLLINAVIGLVIIMGSFAITQFVLQSLINATNGNGGDGGVNGGSGGSSGGGLGGGSSSVFAVTQQRPTGQVSLRNIVPQITFSKTLDATTVTSESVTFTYEATGLPIPGTLSVSGNRVTFVPATPCPSPHEDRFCFDENAQVNVVVTSDVKSSTGSALSCLNSLCSSSFLTGALIDTQDPTAQLTAPDNGQGVSSNAFVPVQVLATDDSQVSVAEFAASDVIFDSVPANGGDNTNLTVETEWDTTGLSNGRTYRLTATVIDLAGNTADDSITVSMRADTCFNNVIDGIETGLNCGGDSTSPDYCGSCSGSSCTDSSECANGMCSNGVCLDLPVIEAVTPADGAPGTWVTLQGRNFGNQMGSVLFSGTSGPALAQFVSCGEAWTDTQVLVQVPAEAVDGPITLQLANNVSSDTTFDDNGPLMADFDVNTVAHPGLCNVTPRSGAPTDSATVTGDGFGDARDSSVVLFGGTEAGSYTAWSSNSATLTVPNVGNGTYPVTVKIGNISSNAITYRVSSNTSATPTITSLTPETGGVGQYVTVSGVDFGGGLGTVWFENVQSGERFLANTEFPDACTDSFWTEREVLVMVPEAIENALGAYNVYLTSNTSTQSNSMPFTLVDQAPSPGLCAISPERGLPGDGVVLYGSNLGNDNGTVTFSSGKEATVDAWSGAQVTVAVPDGAGTGQVVLTTADGATSNPLNFEVSGGGDVTAATIKQAAYAWSFSSGQIPDAPQMIFECSDVRVSGVPNQEMNNGGDACINSVVFAEFTIPMDESTLRGVANGSLEECVGGGNNPCAQTVRVTGEAVTTSASVRFEPSENLKPNTTYRVTTTENMLSAEGVPLANPRSWTFKTRNDSTLCDIEKILVTPNEATIRQLNGTQDFASSPVSGCNVLRETDYTWAWSVDNSFARFDTTSEPVTCPAGNSLCALVQALAEGVTPVESRETRSGVTGEATLTIDFTDPYVTNTWPNCTEACVNAEVGASFNTAMLPASLEGAGQVLLYRCANELCTNLQLVNGTTARCILDAQNTCTGFSLTGANLAPTSFYRVVISGSAKSVSGVSLTRSNYGGDYSWIFRVREDASVCAVDRISVSPSSVLADRIGDQQTFAGEAFGEADSCSVSGQRLSGFSYSWNWNDPIADEDLDDDATTRVAEWSNDQLVDTDIDQVALGCTAACTAAGSLPQAAVCGDGRRDYGEECEDGNVANGDGCSASCLREGGVAPQCGNGVINRSLQGGGEDCDDGNLVSGDGCSSTCLAEGSSSVGATCGNGDVATLNPLQAQGEECDDGNARRGDGCSNECLWEGSPTLVEVGGVICGDGILEQPTEQCEDGNTSTGDGCSDRCLWEGSAVAYGSACGNGGSPEYGEACDDGNLMDGDGCSSRCLWEGSSSLYSSPSFCGDGVVGLGELAMCEANASGDGKIDPLQVAVIAEDAALEVDVGTQRAVATIEVTEVDSGLTTTAEFALSCTAESDAECAEPDAYGVGQGGCCMERPTVTLFPNAGSVCRNAALYGTFSQPMDLDSLAYEVTENGATYTKYRMYARLDTTSTNFLCPTDHTRLAVEPRSLVLRVWNTLVRFVTGKTVQADTGDCVAPITSFEQIAVGDGTYKVRMHTKALLAANGRYTLVVEGDNNIDDTVTDGVVNKYGVGMNGTQSQAFTVGAEVCALQSVTLTDTETASPYVFTRGDETHVFMSSAYAYVGGIPQEIQTIDGVYAWEWSGWESESDGDIVVVAQRDTDPASATVQAAGQNGNDTVFATATITSNTANVPGASSITGSVDVLAFLCENPWPGSFASLPWSDTDAGDQGAEEGIGWMNFSTMYCRDQGADTTTDDLPEVTVVRPPGTQSPNVIKEYLYEVAGSSDAIGIRVVSNPEYLSPEAWYQSQGFTGELSDAEVDAFEAGVDGRTTYVVAPNASDSGVVHSNVYVISYNAGASQETIDIYNQMVENMQFAINVEDIARCQTGETTCWSDRDRLRRDTRRLSDLTDIRSAVLEYQAVNGVIPGMPSGTFVRAMSSSVWESWKSILGGALSMPEVPADPLNYYVSCGQDGSSFSAYDAQTCVNEQLGAYVCPVNSHAYHYRAVGENLAILTADLELSNLKWANQIDGNPNDAVMVSIGNSSSGVAGFTSAAYCNGQSVYGTSAVCGDGVVGGAEVCELGQFGGSVSLCRTPENLNGIRSQICGPGCRSYVNDANAVCVVATCGNGVIEAAAGEECDDGSLNGVYGFCGNDCTRETAFFCGDGQLAGGEACDCGLDAAMSYADGRAYGAGPGSCADINGVYSSSPHASCSWDCSGPASYCGDGVVDAGEQCDGEDVTWAGKLCSSSSPSAYKNQPCTTDSECGGGVCGGTGAGNRQACPLGQTRVKTCDDGVGGTCGYTTTNWFNIACTQVGACGDGVVDPGEACDDGNTDGTDGCTDICQLNVCGDGQLYVGQEQCDQGTDNGQGCDSAYGSSCTACSLSCRYEVTSGEFCGDGERNGDEFCDANDMPYTYYNANHETTYGSCNNLGRQVTNPADGFRYTCTQLGVCNGSGGADYNGAYCQTNADCGTAQCVMPTCSQSCSNSCPFTYSSTSLLLTTNQPGADASEIANIYSYSDSSTSDLPNAATLTVPACNVATGLTASVSLRNVELPTTYILFITDLSMTMKNEVGANVLAVPPERSRLEIARSAIPVAVEELFDKLGNKAKVGAIGYRGLRAGQCFYDPNISCNATLGTGCPVGDTCNRVSSSVDSSLENVVNPYGYVFDFVGPDREDELTTHVATYTYDPLGPNRQGHGTFTYEALLQAKNMFDEIKDSSAGDNARYIAILLSDGEVTTNTRSMDGRVSPNPILIAQDFDAYIPDTAGYELYTATIGTDPGQTRNMKNWSSNSYNGRENSFATIQNDRETNPAVGTARNTSTFNGLDYAYEAETETDLEAMYEQIVDSIADISMTIISDDGRNVTETTGSVEEGENVLLPWPENFICNDLYEQQVPVRVSFPGVGQIQISNVHLNYCAP